jgi:N-acetylglucosaminyldiphosphoundecaprenol N-acetyl-beta-D-mannosaminyltransferase
LNSFFAFLAYALKMTEKDTIKPSQFKRISLLGAFMDVMTKEDLLSQIAAFIADKNHPKARLIGNHNLHSLYLCLKNPEFRAAYQKTDLVEIDSMPLIAWGGLMGHELKRENRLTYLDFRDDFWAFCQANSYRIHHIGGVPEAVEPARLRLLADFPNLDLSLDHGYFALGGSEDEAMIQKIEQMRPDILLVGMGMPRQELWIANHFERLRARVIMPIGAAFDYEAGLQYQPDRAAGQMGIEWLIRLIHDPKRLAKRYLIEPWFLVPLMLKDIGQRLRQRPLS